VCENRHVSDVLDRGAAGRSALDARRWREGYDLLAAAAASGDLPPEDLELLAWSAYLTDEIVQVVPVLERAYAGYVAAGNKARAAVAAVQLAHEYGSVRLQKAIGSGWLARAERLLEGEPEGVAHGYLALERGLGAMRVHDYEASRELGGTAERIGAEHGDMGLELRGRQRRAVSLIHLGEIDEGRRLLNEVNAAAYGGTLQPYDTVVLYCNAIGTCREVAAYDEASQWTQRAELFCDEHAISAFPGVCRINRAEVMRYEGKLEDAEKAASEATQLLASWAPRIAAAGYAEVGEVRLRLGDLAKAEEAFDLADDLGHDPEPGRSLLLLAREKPAAALASIRRALGDELSPLTRARLLPAFVEIATAAEAIDEAAAAADQLTETAHRYDAPALHAAAAVAAGSVALARDDADGAVRPLRRALRLWQDTNARYEAGRARVLLARAYAATGDAEGAMHELAQAGSVFDQLGARIDAAKVDALLGRDAGTRVTMTFVFTDIVDSTRHLEHHGDSNWQKLLRRHDELVRRITTREGGSVVDHTGDGFFLAFPTAERAVAAAVEIQREAAGDLPFEIRIGVHTAEATSLGENYRGKGVHVAARIGALGGGEEIVASLETVAALNGIRTSEPRSEQLKGITEPVDVVSVDWRGAS
jgi:class 3 adenylate cyclase